MLIKRSVGPLCFLSCIDVELMTLPSPLYLFWGCLGFAERSFSCIDFVTLLCCLVNPLWISLKALSVLGFVVMNHPTYQGKKKPLDQLNLINGWLLYYWLVIILLDNDPTVLTNISNIYTPMHASYNKHKFNTNKKVSL